MGLFSSKSTNSTSSNGGKVRGGCAQCDMRGPKRATSQEASKDIQAHNKRMHGTAWTRNSYIEGC